MAEYVCIPHKCLHIYMSCIMLCVLHVCMYCSNIAALCHLFHGILSRCPCNRTLSPPPSHHHYWIIKRLYEQTPYLTKWYSNTGSDQQYVVDESKCIQLYYEYFIYVTNIVYIWIPVNTYSCNLNVMRGQGCGSLCTEGCYAYSVFE